MENYSQKIHSKSKRRKADWNLTTKALLVRIGSRSSSNY